MEVIHIAGYGSFDLIEFVHLGLRYLKFLTKIAISICLRPYSSPLSPSQLTETSLRARIAPSLLREIRERKGLEKAVQTGASAPLKNDLR